MWKKINGCDLTEGRFLATTPTMDYAKLSGLLGPNSKFK